MPDDEFTIDVVITDPGSPTIVAPAMDPQLYRDLVNWTVKFLVEKASAEAGGPRPEPAHEFDCVECGRHIVVIAGPRSEFGLCAACICMPGWHRDPQLRRMLNPGDADG